MMGTGTNRILVVDDEPSVRRSIARFLCGAGWDVVAVGSGREALAAFEAGRFDLLLTDVNLNDAMDGIELAGRLLALEPGLRVVVMSGTPSNAEKARAANLPEFMAKPLDFPRMAELLRR